MSPSTEQKSRCHHRLIPNLTLQDTDRNTFKGDIAESIQEQRLPLLVSVLEILDCLLFIL